MSEREQELANGRYVLYPDRPLGSGHFGKVFEGYDRHFEQAVAVKLFDEDFELDAVLLEAQLQRRVSEHPHVVDIYDVIAEPPRPFVVTALCPSGSVGDRLETGAVSLQEAMRWTRDLLAGLAHAHSLEVIHRDVKPSNALLRTEGGAALTDFGLAEDTLRDRIVDTSHYLPHVAPEVLAGQSSSKQTDVFAAGCTIYRLLTGEYPFEGGDFSSGPTAACRLNPTVPMAVSRAVGRALAIDPGERYTDAIEMHS